MTELKEPPQFGVDTIDSLKPPSNAEQDRIARNAAHPGADTSIPAPRVPEDQRPHLKFPEPKYHEVDGRRFTSLGEGTHVYTGPNGEDDRELIGDIVDVLSEGEYVKRLPHPNPKMVPSIKLFFEKPVRVRTPDGEIIDYTGSAFSDRRGEGWEGMVEKSTTRKMREKKNL